MGRIDTLRTCDCCGCGACVVACPQKCISLERDGEGFDYPRVDAAACSACGRCWDICSFRASHQALSAQAVPRAFAAWCLDPKIRAQSTSGGVFTVLAEHVLSEGGVVYGAAFDATCRQVRHVRVTAAEGLSALRNSKYVQSRTVEALRQARDDVAAGVRVLFSGTPCQIAALRRLVGPDAGSLITCDLVCHGVPSPGVFEKYMREQDAADGVTTTGYSFRDKAHGWNFARVRRVFSDRRVRFRMNWRDPFVHGFYRGVFLRPACYVCPFAQRQRVADLTLGDYWGVGTRYPAYDDNRGTSLVLVNTKAGEALLTACADRLFCAPGDLEHALAHNSPLVKPARQPVCRATFFQVFGRAPFTVAARVYMRRGAVLKRVAIRIVKRLLWPARRLNTRLLSLLARETSAGRVIPEVDGLRFIAIASVVFYHLLFWTDVRNAAPCPASFAPLAAIIHKGHLGVNLFFTISGFILCIPFTRHYLTPGDKVFSLKRYFIRRVCRIEPPYVIYLLVCGAIRLFCFPDTAGTLLGGWLATLFYYHNTVLGRLSTVSGITWSLEIEVQFYILAPLIAYLFCRFRDARVRRTLLACAIVAMSVANHGYLYRDINGANLGNFIQYFLCGYLMADFYALSGPPTRRTYALDALTLVPAAALLILSTSVHADQLLAPPMIVLLFIAALWGKAANWFLSRAWIYTIGGMCYSIYLYHSIVYGFYFAHLHRLPFPSYWLNVAFVYVTGAVLILAVSGVAFVLFEKPFMLRDWPQRTRNAFRRRARAIPHPTGE